MPHLRKRNSYGFADTDCNANRDGYCYSDAYSKCHAYGDSDTWPGGYNQSGNERRKRFRYTQWLSQSAWVDYDCLFPVGHDNQLQRAHHRCADPDWECVPAYHCQHQRFSCEHHLIISGIVATNSGGTRYGSDRTFTTTGPPVVATNPATNVASFSATLNGSVNPDGLSTTVRFQYGRTTSYGSTTTSQTKSGNTTQNVAVNISGLAANKTYHFRIVATNSNGTTYGVVLDLYHVERDWASGRYDQSGNQCGQVFS